MKIIDRLLVKELIKFAFLALVSVVAIYLLIDLFEELGYFTSRKVAFSVLLLHYFYSLPSAITLLYPVSLILAVFMVYGQMTRNNEISALRSAGVLIYRLFVPAVSLGGATVFIYLLGNEFVTIPFNRRLSDLRRFVIEKRAGPVTQKRMNVYRVDGNIAFWARELELSPSNCSKVRKAILRNFTVLQLDRDRRVVQRFDGDSAICLDSGWVGMGVVARSFISRGKGVMDEAGENLDRFEQIKLSLIPAQPEEWFAPGRPVEETPTIILGNYIARMKATGENVAREEVEYHYRFSYSLIGLIVVLLGLPFAVRLRSRGGVMFGLGLGLLFSFLYWGAIQTARAFGTSHILTPALSAWLPNIIFSVVAAVFMLKVEG